MENIEMTSIREIKKRFYSEGCTVDGQIALFGSLLYNVYDTNGNVEKEVEDTLKEMSSELIKNNDVIKGLMNKIEKISNKKDLFKHFFYMNEREWAKRIDVDRLIHEEDIVQMLYDLACVQLVLVNYNNQIEEKEKDRFIKTFFTVKKYIDEEKSVYNGTTK